MTARIALSPRLTQAACLLAALALASGCASKQKSALDKMPTPAPKAKPMKVDLTDIQRNARDLKDEGIVNKPLVRYLVSARSYGLAIKHTNTLLEKNSWDAELYYLKGYALMELDMHEEAVKELKTACKMEKNYAEAWNALGMTYDKMKKTEESEAAYLKAIGINPNSAKYLNNLGFSYFSRGDYKKAADTYNRALALDSSNVQIHNNLGFAYGMLGRYDDAFAEFQQGGTEDVAYNNMGFIYYMLGYNSQAKGMYAKAIEINPNFTKALENLRLISGGRKLLPPYPPYMVQLSPTL